MRSNPRGLVLIITNVKYIYTDDRPSAIQDEQNLDKLFKDMGFKTIRHRDVTLNVGLIMFQIFNCYLK